MSDGASNSARLAIVIPTRDRAPILTETVRRLGQYGRGEEPIELIVVNDGLAHATKALAERIEVPREWRVEVIDNPGRGPASARNAGVRATSAPVILFLGDDSIPAPGLIETHLRSHDAGDTKTAVLGLATPCPPLDNFRLQRWLHEGGVQFGYGSLAPGTLVDPACFWTTNVSLSRALFEEAEGFNETFENAACEDAELGYRLARLGMRLRYEPAARVQHFHPTNLEQTLRRMARVATAYRLLVELAPEAVEPPRPSRRHALKAAAFELMCRLRPSFASSEQVWLFVCHQTMRERYWSDDIEDSVGPVIGRRLTRLALARPEACPAMDASPCPA